MSWRIISPVRIHIENSLLHRNGVVGTMGNALCHRGLLIPPKGHWRKCKYIFFLLARPLVCLSLTSEWVHSCVQDGYTRLCSGGKQWEVGGRRCLGHVSTSYRTMAGLWPPLHTPTSERVFILPKNNVKRNLCPFFALSESRGGSWGATRGWQGESVFYYRTTQSMPWSYSVYIFPVNDHKSSSRAAVGE